MGLQVELESVFLMQVQKKKTQQRAPADAEQITMLKIIQEFVIYLK